MKKTAIALLMASLMCWTAGCSQTEQKSTSDSPVDNIVLTVGAEADQLKMAFSLDELYSDADLVVKAKITESYPTFHSDGSGRVFTHMIPEIITIYKGDYNNQELVTCGGIMELSKYSESGNAPIDDYTEGELETGYVYYNWLNNYIPQEDDEIIFFGKYSDQSDSFRNLYSYQGIYLCNEGNVTIKSLEYQPGDGWIEPLAHDLIDNFGADIRYNDWTIDVTCNEDSFTAAFQ